MTAIVDAVQSFSCPPAIGNDGIGDDDFVERMTFDPNTLLSDTASSRSGSLAFVNTDGAVFNANVMADAVTERFAAMEASGKQAGEAGHASIRFVAKSLMLYYAATSPNIVSDTTNMPDYI